MSLDNYGLPQPTGTSVVNYQYNILSIILFNCNKWLPILFQSLPKNNNKIFEFVKKTISSNEGAILFLDLPGGTGKTYLVNLCLAEVTKTRNMAVAVASSGIIATLLEGGRAAHSALKLPMNLTYVEKPICHIITPQANVLENCKLLVCDEITMSHKWAIEVLEKLLRDMKQWLHYEKFDNSISRRFWQILPVISKGALADELNACLEASCYGKISLKWD